MAAIGGLVVGLGMTGGFAYGVYDLRKKGDTKSTKFQGFVAGLVIGALILLMSLVMLGRSGYQKVQQVVTGAGPSEEELAIMTSKQLKELQQRTLTRKVNMEALLERLTPAIEAAEAAEQATEAITQLAAAAE